MNQTVAADPLLPRLRGELEKLYGPKLKQVLLYGSRARGDHGPDSDYDVLVVVEGPIDYWKEVEKACPPLYGHHLGDRGTGTSGRGVLQADDHRAISGAHRFSSQCA
jgi:hypothetical protein